MFNRSVLPPSGPDETAEFPPSDKRGRARIAREMAAEADCLAVAAFNEECGIPIWN